MAPRSPQSALSSPASFHTAVQSDISPATSASGSAQRRPCPYRKSRPLPRELKEHTQIFLEEQMYVPASQLLNSVLVAGKSRQNPTSRPVPIPPPSHIAFLTTLLVHPTQTTRPTKPEQVDVAAFALRYLRNLLRIVGPVEANFRAAFQFYSAPRSNRRSFAPVGNSSDVDSPSKDDEDDADLLRGTMANQGSLWRRGQNFWSTVGWAFNCSTLYPMRWRFWKEWLQFMIDALEADWNERERRDLEAQEQDDNDTPANTSRNESIIVMYMSSDGNAQGGFKHIVKSLLADGGNLSSAAFREVFDKELRGPRKESSKRKREETTLDIENGNFGDYFDDDAFSSGASQPPTPERQRDIRGSTFGATWPGLVESVDLRMRLFSLLSKATMATGKRGDLERLYELFAASLKVIPLEFFAVIMAHHATELPVDITICKELFHLLLPASYKDPSKIDPANDAEGNISSLMMEHCYMPYPANTISIEDNARLSLVVEKALLLLLSCDELEYTDSFRDAACTGIEARNTKVQKKRTGKAKPDAEDVSAQNTLTSSGERLRILMGALSTQT